MNASPLHELVLTLVCVGLTSWIELHQLKDDVDMLSDVKNDLAYCMNRITIFKVFYWKRDVQPCVV